LPRTDPCAPILQLREIERRLGLFQTGHGGMKSFSLHVIGGFDTNSGWALVTLSPGRTAVW